MVDIELDPATLQPLVADGDWVAGPTDHQHQALLLLTAQGAWKENPGVGVGASRFAEAERPDELLREIRQQYTADGMTVNSLQYDVPTGKLVTDANYLAA